ncbi:glyoxalase i [Leishmania tarentolae]|uniref:lactoylglutathione lyase n=1 Tax=Leishmania tarentolae TaxID=5689 RepID=A0A640KZ61_LEITA|nr:glyoxalase i [Leishmania tarentolae]
MPPYRMLHTMIRVGDLDRSIKFYTERLGMKVLRKWDVPQDKYTLVFLGYGPEKNSTVLELTYNYGVTSYEHGEAYGHIAIGVDDVKALVADMRKHDVPIDYEDESGFMAFVVDPDGYYVELLNEKMMMEKAETDMKEQGTA